MRRIKVTKIVCPVCLRRHAENVGKFEVFAHFVRKAILRESRLLNMSRTMTPYSPEMDDLTQDAICLMLEGGLPQPINVEGSDEDKNFFRSLRRYARRVIRVWIADKFRLVPLTPLIDRTVIFDDGTFIPKVGGQLTPVSEVELSDGEALEYDAKFGQLKLSLLEAEAMANINIELYQKAVAIYGRCRRLAWTATELGFRTWKDLRSALIVSTEGEV